MRNVRNFWITTDADGVKTRQATGPRAKDGGFFTSVEMRNAGTVTTALDIAGHALPDGTLRLTVHDGDGRLIFVKEVPR